MRTMQRFVVLGSVISAVTACLLALGINWAFAEDASPAGADQAARIQLTQATASYYGALVIGAAIMGGLGCLGAGYAVGHVGAAALGAASERPEMLLRSLIIIALGEGIAILGLAFAFLFIMRLPR